MNQLIEHENHLIQQFLIIGFQEIKDGIHCFPNGLEIKESKFEDDELFFFSLDNIGTTLSLKYPKIYFQCLLFQEKIKDDFFTQKALVLISFFPLFNEFGIILTNLKKNIFEDTLIVSLENFIHNLIFEIPSPIPGITIINYCFNNSFNLKLTLGEINKIPIPKSDIKILFKFFGINTLEKILTCILLETPILVFCENKQILCNIVKGFEEMIIPFKYPHTIIELLPVVYYSIIEEIDIFIIGINKKFTNTFFNNDNFSIRNKNVLVVDVLSEPNSKIFFFEGNNEENDLFKTKKDELKSEIDKIESLKINLPKYYTGKLKNKINDLCEDKDGTKKNFQDLNNKDIEGIFYYYFVCLFLKYKSCLNYSERDLALNYPLIEKNKIKASDLFKEEDFLSDIVPCDKLFYQKFFKTEIWKKFLIKTLYCKELKEKMEVMLFDEMIRVKRNKKVKLIKTQTPFLDYKKFEYIKEIKCGIKFDKPNNNNNNPIPKDYFPLLDYSKLNKKNLINDISFKYIDDFKLRCLEIINEKKSVDPKAKTNITFNFINNINPKVENYIYKLWFLVFAKSFPFCDKRERWFKFNNFINYIEHKIFHHQSTILDEYLSNLILMTLIKYGDKEMCSMFFKFFKYKSYLNYLFLNHKFSYEEKIQFLPKKSCIRERNFNLYELKEGNRINIILKTKCKKCRNDINLKNVILNFSNIKSDNIFYKCKCSQKEREATFTLTIKNKNIEIPIFSPVYIYESIKNNIKIININDFYKSHSEFFYNIIIYFQLYDNLVYDFIFPYKEKLGFSENKYQIIQNDKFTLKAVKEENDWWNEIEINNNINHKNNHNIE